jgi:hypothetical protein
MTVGGVASDIVRSAKEAVMLGVGIQLNSLPRAHMAAAAGEPTVVMVVVPLKAERARGSSSMLDATRSVVAWKMFWKTLHVVALLAAACL